MRVLFISRDTLFSSPGGDTIQLVKTAEELRKIGVSVDIHRASDPQSELAYDIIHYFNVIRPTDILHNIQIDIPYVLSTIYVDYGEFEKAARGGISGFIAKVLSANKIEYLKTINRFVRKQERMPPLRYLLFGHKSSVRYVINGAKYLLPNSESEYRRLAKDYDIQKAYTAIPNSIDDFIFAADAKPDKKFENAVVCLARVEGRKNQLNLIRALNGTSINLFIIGNASPNSQGYFNQCQKEAGSNVHFIPHVTQQDAVQILQAAKVHAMPSWFETTGLSSLEAAVMGCNIVITRKGDQEEYFGDEAFYCDPDNISSIRLAVEMAIQAPVSVNLATKIRREYTWQKTAEKTLACYQDVLKRK